MLVRSIPLWPQQPDPPADVHDKVWVNAHPMLSEEIQIRFGPDSRALSTLPCSHLCLCEAVLMHACMHECMHAFYLSMKESREHMLTCTQ